MMVVIAVIAILMAIIGSNAFNAVRKANDVRVETDFRSIKTGASSYFVDTGNWPANGNPGGFIANDGQAGWQGPYLEKWPVNNPWGGNYIWVSDNSGIFAASGINERYVTTSSVSAASAVRIDRDLDDSNGLSGSIRYSNGTGVLSFSVSYDAN